MNDGNVVTDTSNTPAAPPPPVRNENGTFTQTTVFVLPAVLEKRKEIAKSLGFVDAKGDAAIGDVRPALKVPERAEAAKKYIELVKTSAEKLEGSITYPDISVLKPEDVQELVSSRAKELARNAILGARRKGEDLPLVSEYTIFDLMGESEDESVEYDEIKDAVLTALEGFLTEKNFNPTTRGIIGAAITYSKAQMLRLRKFFTEPDGKPGALARAQDAFASWAATKADVDFEAVTLWLKRQNKRLASAMATKEIDETEVTI